ncbi:MAG: diguanylate cyclase [Planctomycetes bacterium]|nr:diguanylate cyclase [Planctomycetota bacterium]
MPTPTTPDDLSRLAFTDELTGLFNRRYLNRYLSEEVDWQGKRPPSLSVLMIDADHFKQVNDQHGHAVGDAVLRVVARSFRTGMRDGDVPCRYAGDEFVAVLPGADEATALDVGERVRVAVAQAGFRPSPGAEPLSLSLSIGAATFPRDGGDAETLLEAADQALYVSKRLGRNRVSHIARVEGSFLREFQAQKAIPCRRFVGREREKEAYAAAARDVAAGRNLAVGITGRRGSGKSRLLSELARLPGSELRLSCECKRGERPLAPLVGPLERHLAGSLEEVDRVAEALPDEIRAAARELLPSLARATARRGRERWISPEERPRYSFEGIVQTLVELSAQRPVHVFLDDLGFADPATVELVKVLSRLPRGRVLLVTAYAEQERDAWGKPRGEAGPLRELEGTGGLREVAVSPFGPEHVSEMLSAMLPNRPFSPDLDLTLVEACGGNPLYVEESVRRLLLERKVRRAGTSWEVASLGRGDLPADLQAALEARRAWGKGAG